MNDDDRSVITPLYRQGVRPLHEHLVQRTRPSGGIHRFVPLPEIAVAQEAIKVMLDDGQAELDLISKLNKADQRRIRVWTLRCSRSCVLAEVYQRASGASRVIRAHGNILRHGRWEPSPPLAFPADRSGMDIVLRLRCRCTGSVVATTPGELINSAIAEPGGTGIHTTD